MSAIVINAVLTYKYKVTNMSTEVLLQGPHKLSFDDRKDELRLLNTARHLASEKQTLRIPAAAGRRGTFELYEQKQNGTEETNFRSRHPLVFY